MKEIFQRGGLFIHIMYIIFIIMSKNILFYLLLFIALFLIPLSVSEQEQKDENITQIKEGEAENNTEFSNRTDIELRRKSLYR